MDINPRAKRNAILFIVVATAGLWAFALLNEDGLFSSSGPYVNTKPEFSLRDLGFLSGPGGTPLAWILALAVGVGYSVYSVRNIPLVRQHWRKLSVLKLLGVSLAFAAAIVEEAAFRRLVMDLVLNAGGGSIIQVIASGLLFGFVHGIWGIMTGRIAVGVGTMIATGTLGAALGVVYLVGERSLAPPIVSHFIITAVIQPGIMFAAFTGTMHRPDRG